MDIAKIMLFFVLIAAVATLLAVAITYWYIWLGIGVAGFFGLKFYNAKKDKANQV